MSLWVFRASDRVYKPIFLLYYSFCMVIRLYTGVFVACTQQPFTSFSSVFSLLYAVLIMYNSFWILISWSWGLLLVFFQHRLVFEGHLLGLVIPCRYSSLEIWRLHRLRTVFFFNLCMPNVLLIAYFLVDDGCNLEIEQFISETFTFHLCLSVLAEFWLRAFWGLYFQACDIMWIGLAVILLRHSQLLGFSVLRSAHYVLSFSFILLRLFWFAVVLQHALVIFVFIGEFRLHTYPHFDMVSRLWIIYFGVCFTLLFYCRFFPLCGLHCLSCNLDFWVTINFYSKAREKLAFSYFSKANLLSAIFGLCCSESFDWLSQPWIHDMWRSCRLTNLLRVGLIFSVCRTCNLYTHYVIRVIGCFIMNVSTLDDAHFNLGFWLFRFLVLF